MADSYALAADAVKQIFDREFRAEGIVAIHDNLHGSLGQRGPVAGIAPARQIPMPGNQVVQETWLNVKLLNTWTPKVNPAMVVDPRIITGYADRFLEALRTSAVTISGDVWYLSFEGVEYPNDPVGNKSRFTMTIRARGNNPSLIETTG